MRINDVMSRKVWTVYLREPLERARSEMTLRRVHHLVVVDGRERRRTSLRPNCWRGARRQALLVSRMSCSATSSLYSLHFTIREAANLLRGRTVGALPILEGKRLVGIVTISDFLDLLGQGAERPVPSSRQWTLRDCGKEPRGVAQGTRAR